MESKYKYGNSEFLLTLILISSILPGITIISTNFQETEGKINQTRSAQSDYSISKPLIDEITIATHDLNYTTGSSLKPAIPQEMTLNSIEYNISSAQQTQQIINNGQMDQIDKDLIANWSRFTSSNNSAGILYNRNTSATNQNSLMLGINGSQSTQNFSCFPSPSYTETFNSYENFAKWNISNPHNPSEYNISLSQFMTPQISSKAENSPAVLMNYTGQISKQFFYNGTIDITDIYLEFRYMTSTEISPEIANLTVWIQKPNLERIWLKNQSFTSETYDSAKFYFADFEGIFSQTGNYSLIFQFNHSVQISSSEINIDDVTFWITYKARNIIQNESIGFQQILNINRTILSNGILNLSVYCETPLPQMNTSGIILSVILGNSILGTRQLQSFASETWVTVQMDVEKTIFTQNQLNLTVKWQFNTTNTTIFRPNDIWRSYFDNISLFIDTIPKKADVNITIIFTNFGSFEPKYSQNFSIQLNSFGIIRIEANTTSWLNTSNFSFEIRYEESIYPIIFLGNITYQYYSWRDFLVLESSRCFEPFLHYPDKMLSILSSSKIPWSYLLNLSSLFPYIAQENYPYLIYEANELNANFGRYFASYILWQNQNAYYKPKQMDFILNSLLTLQNSTETATLITNFLNSYWEQTQNSLQTEFNTFYQQISQTTYSTTMNFSAIQQQITTNNQIMQLTLSGYPTTIQLALQSKSIIFPSLIWWDEFLITQPTKLTKPNAQNTKLIEWIKDIQIIDNATQLYAAYPLLFANGFEVTDNLEKTSIPISQELFYSMALFEFLLTNFQLMNNIEDNFVGWKDIILNDYAQANINNSNISQAILFETSDEQRLNIEMKESVNESITFEILISSSQWNFSLSAQSPNIALDYEIWTFLPQNSSWQKLIPLNIITGQVLKSKIRSENGMIISVYLSDSIIQQELLKNNGDNTKYSSLLYYVQIKDFNRIIFSNWTDFMYHGLTHEIKNQNISYIPQNPSNSILIVEPVSNRNFTLQEFHFPIIPLIPRNLWLDIQWNQKNQQKLQPKLIIPIQSYSSSTRIMINNTQIGSKETENGKNQPFSFQFDKNLDDNITLLFDPDASQINELGTIVLSTTNSTKPLNYKVRTISGISQIEINYTVSSNPSIICSANVEISWMISSPLIQADSIDTTPIWILSIGIFSGITIIYIIRQKKRFKQIKLREDY